MYNNTMEGGPGRPPSPEKARLLKICREYGLEFGEGFKCTISLRNLRKLVKIITGEEQ